MRVSEFLNPIISTIYLRIISQNPGIQIKLFLSQKGIRIINLDVSNIVINISLLSKTYRDSYDLILIERFM